MDNFKTPGWGVQQAINLKNRDNKFFKTTFFLAIAFIFFSAALNVYFRNNLNTIEEGQAELEIRLAHLESQNLLKEEKIQQYNTLVNNLNLLLSTVYFGRAESENGQDKQNFTAFSMQYKDRYYLITAGHCIEFEDRVYTDFMFKPNYSEIWIKPRLIAYSNDHANNRDFAVFYSGRVRKGLIVDQDDREPKYVLGAYGRRENLLKEFDGNFVQGESGSPILSKNSKLVGITIKSNTEYTPIEVVTDAIDKIDWE